LQKVFKINHSKKRNLISKVSYKILANKPFVDQIYENHSFEEGYVNTWKTDSGGRIYAKNACLNSRVTQLKENLEYEDAFNF
jgi:hypothetical protein